MLARKRSAQSPASERPIGVAAKVRLLTQVWVTAASVVIGLRRDRLPNLIARLGTPANRRPIPASLLSRAVSRGLRIGPWQPRCLIRALVLYRLLRAQGDAAVLVIGLAAASPSTEAHAWVELEGRDIGPVPGANGHRALARYPLDAEHDTPA